MKDSQQFIANNHIDFPIRILGIDPGFHVCGWGIVDVWSNKKQAVCGGIIKSDKVKISQNHKNSNVNPIINQSHNKYADRLANITIAIRNIFYQYKPNVVSMETTYINSNPRTSLTLSQARGAIAAVVGEFRTELFDYAPRTIKKTVAGHGNANKTLVQKMVKVFLPELNEINWDQSDAFAVALCHAQHKGW